MKHITSSVLQSRYAELVLIATTVIAASGWIFSKQAIAQFPPFGFIGLRFILASLFLLPFCYRQLFRVEPLDLLKSLAIGMLLGSALLLWIYAVSVSDALGEGAFIMSLSMLFVPFVAWLFFGDRPSKAFWCALPVAVIGLVLLFSAGQLQQSSNQLWFVLSALMLAIHFSFNSYFARKVPVLLLTCIQLFSTGILGLVISLWFDVWPSTIAGSTWSWFWLSVLLATSFRYVLQTYGQKETSTETAALIMILEPVWTLLFSLLWFDDSISPLKLIGCGLILLSVLISRNGRRLSRLFT